MLRPHPSLILLLLACSFNAAAVARDPFSTKRAITAGPYARPNTVEGCGSETVDERIKKPLTLSDVIDLSLCNNPQVRLQWASARTQAAQLGVSESSYFPSLSGPLSASGSRTAVAGTTTPTDQKSIGVTVSYLLYDFGGREASVKVAKQLLVAANATRDDTLRATFLNAVQAYYTLLLARASVAAYQIAETTAEKNFGAAGVRYQAGSGTSFDRLQSQTALSQAKLNRIRAEGDVAKAQGTLANIMGFYATQPFELAVTTESPSDFSATSEPIVAEQDEMIEQDIGKLIDEARKSRPDMRAAEAQIEAAKAQLVVTRAAAMPSISLNASVSQSQSTDTANSSRGQSLGVTVHVPWFSGFRDTYEARAGQGQLEGKVAEGQRVANQIALEVWKAYQTLLTSSQTLRVANDLEASAEQAEKIASGRYRAGVGSILDVLNAQTILANARQQRVTALYDFKISKFVLAQAIGQLDLTLIETKNRVETKNRIETKHREETKNRGAP